MDAAKSLEESLLGRIKNFLNQLDIINTLFLSLTPVIAFIGTGILLWKGSIPGATWLLGLGMAIMTGLAVTAGYHRLFSHRAYDANGLFKLVMLLFGAAAFENSARRWASDHRNHHKFVDTDQDPYNIKRGFFYAHMGWVCLKSEQTHAYDNVPDLDADKLVRFQEKHYVSLGILVGLLLPMAIGSLWGDPWGGLIVGGFLRTVANHHFTFSINSFAHLFGSQPYSDANTARDSWILALFTYGEGYHNFHHKFPSDYRNGIKSYHWDPTKWAVKALSWFGLTQNLRQISDDKILLAKLRMDEKRVVEEISRGRVPNHTFSREFVAGARLKIEEAYVRFQYAKSEYERMKIQKLDSLNTQWHHKVDMLKNDLYRAQTSLQEARDSWKDVCRKFGVRPSSIAYS